MLIASSIEDHARDLLGCIIEKRQDGVASRPLVFVAHSLGGHVVKQVGSSNNTMTLVTLIHTRHS